LPLADRLPDHGWVEVAYWSRYPSISRLGHRMTNGPLIAIAVLGGLFLICGVAFLVTHGTYRRAKAAANTPEPMAWPYCGVEGR
jgi:hypothetical protein